MIQWLMKKIFGSRNARMLKKLQPVVQRINEHAASYVSLTDAQLQAKTDEFKERLQKGETTDEILCEAYAVVKDACRRLCGTTVTVTGHDLVWDMIPFDVQLAGAAALHQNHIAEMATGEGKTLVAIMPLYLNALTGRNVQLVTVNDYLARRDSEWMGHVYKWLGLTVGCLQNNQPSSVRREQYACDITYGTNSEFGFDYLRDMGMAMSREELVQRDHFFAIVDEIDSILIDEARTPLIIAGPAKVSTHMFDKLKPSVAELFRRQNKLMSDFIQQAKKILDNESASDEEIDEAHFLLAKVQLGMPKHRQLMHLMENPAIRKALDKKDLEIHNDNNRGLLQEVKSTLFFAIDEKGHEAELSEKGRQFLRPGEQDAFIIPDLPTIFNEIDSDDSLDDQTKLEQRRQAQAEYDQKSEAIHNISQLLRAYCLFEKDVQYVVQNNKVIIVDEFTGRPQPGRRFSEGLHQALEAKEDVQIERETQTLASITIQNYFRLYEKLAGMTGTAETEANEFKSIYNLDVLVVPTNKPCQRIDSDDRIYKTQREKYKAIIEEVVECNHRGQPVLVGTISVEVSELLSRMLQRQRVIHNVLNAKHHESEAEIVTRAGQLGAVTIATNMAGRGTDIKLGPGVREIGGLHVIGSERHDARRIDRQLRGRCARQGDPGSSRFYISLEDNLMRLFGSDRVASIMEKLGMEEGVELSHKLLNRSVESSQRRVEQQHFSVRKRTLEYDDVMNKQRATIYKLRHDVLFTETPQNLLMDFVFTAVSEKVENAFVGRVKDETVNLTEFKQWLTSIFPLNFPATLFAAADNAEQVTKVVVELIEKAYAQKSQMEHPDALSWLERYIMLSPIDSLYQDHLYAMDALRQGVQLRSYGQRDPLVEYKQEAYELFSVLMDEIKGQICSNIFRLSTLIELPAPTERPQHQEIHTLHEEIDQFGLLSNTEDDLNSPPPGRPAGVTIRREQPKVGRNEPCPCGSGKKYKSCCGR